MPFSPPKKRLRGILFECLILKGGSYMDGMTQIKKEIGVFLDTCIKTHREFLEKLKVVVSETNTAKYKAVSKYHITEAGVDTLNRRIRNNFLAKIHTLTAYYENKIKELQTEYTEMMREHRQLSEDWKTKKDWGTFQQDYKKLTQEVLREKAEFRSTLEKQCEEIRSAANSLLDTFNTLFTNIKNHTKEIELKAYEKFLILRSKENPDDLMVLIMFVDSLNEDE